MLYQQRAAPPPSGEPDEFILSDGSLDRMGDVIDPGGWQLDQIKSDPPVLFNHNRDQIVGRWTNIRVKDGKLIGKIVWAKSDKWPMGSYIRDLVREGILRTVSVGFQPTAKQPLTKDAHPHHGPFRFTKSQLLECSLVSVPANPNALALSKDLPRDVLATVFRKPAGSTDELRAFPAKPGTSIMETKATKMQTQTISQKIQAAQQNLGMLRESLNDLASKQDLDAEEKKRYEEDLPAQIETVRRELDAHRRVERSLVDEPSVPLQAPQPQQDILPPLAAGHSTLPEHDGRKLFAVPKQKIADGDYVARALAIWTKQHVTKDPFEKILREGYQNDEKTNIVLRAAVNPAMTTVATWAAELVQTSNVDYLDRLIPNFVYPQLKAMGTNYSFGNNGVLKIPVRANTPALAGAWVGEAAAKPVKRMSFSTVSLTPTKLAVISTFSEEMATYGMPSIEGIIRQAMSDDTGVALDTYLIDNVAASAGIRPAGLLNGVTPITASAATPVTAAMVADLKALVGAITAAGGGGRGPIAVLVNPAQALSLSFAQTTTGDFLFQDQAQAASKFGVRFIVSATVPAGRVIAIDAADFATASSNVPQFAVSTEATLHEEDTTPLALGSGAQGSGVLAVPMRSLFQTDAVAIRMSLYVSWAMRRAGMVQTIAAVTW
jgi:HK97 family phage major capsid protein/HK97 family phage prohead protease